MGRPSINIVFTSAAASAIARSQKGIVALILKDAAEAAQGAHVLTNISQIPAALSADNKEYITRAFLGYVNPPRKLIVFVEDDAAADLSTGLAYLATQVFDYLAGPPDITSTECAEVVTWVKAQRALGAVYKAVLPEHVADCEAIVNFAATGIMVGETEYTAGDYCSRIAGLIAGTPLNISCTYAPLPEVSEIDRLTPSAADTALDAGKFILEHDGIKVKASRGVNSLTTTSDAKGAAFKKIKIVEAVDLISRDLRLLTQDEFIGRYANSYDNKCVLIAAIRDYFRSLENAGVLKAGESTIGIDVEAQEAYLKTSGVDTSDMTEKEIKEANTGSKVFLAATLSIIDAIEDIALNITI